VQRPSNSSSSDERLVLHLVIGAHIDTPIPDEVLRNGLTHRFAVIVDPCSESAVPSETTARVVSAIFLEIACEFASTRVLATMLDGTEYRELRDVVNQILVNEELKLPAKICYYHERTMVCLEYTEFWSEVGGPQPYSDSVTLSFYTPSDSTLRLIHACERVSAQESAVLGQFYGGSVTLPTSARNWRRRALGHIDRVRKWIGAYATKLANALRRVGSSP